LLPLLDHLAGYGVGSLGEIFEGDPPFKPVGCIAQAWSAAEILRAWRESEILSARTPKQKTDPSGSAS
jgi:glycogen debranching enzyme